MLLHATASRHSKSSILGARVHARSRQHEVLPPHLSLNNVREQVAKASRASELAPHLQIKLVCLQWHAAR
eukprot:2988033-Amphidinium_carterae.1